MPVNLWSFESGIYPTIDAAGMRGEDCVEMKKLALGEENYVAVKIQTLDDKTLSNQRRVEAKNLLFRVNFWKESAQPWYRVDTDNGFLHFHLEAGNQTIKSHVALPEDKTMGELVSFAFEEARKFLNSKSVPIVDGESFGGFG
jgi:hypothetical protein